jgi:hypothetical protein
MGEKILVTNYETGKEKPYRVPFEIKLLMLRSKVIREAALSLGTNPALQKYVGNSWPIKKNNFSENHERTHHANGENIPVLPSDGYLTRSEISEEGISTVLGHLEIDIKRMLGLTQLTEEPLDPAFQNEMEGSLGNLKGGQHDLAILKPRHKHCCTVPFKSTVKNIYRVGKDGSILPDKIVDNKIHEEKYSTDPKFSRENPDLHIFDGNQRMVFVLETEIDGKPMEYTMVAHAAAFVSGIESLVNKGQEISPKTPLFNFHQGSSLSTIWPKEFHEKFQSRKKIEEKTTNNKVLEVLEGQVIYEGV